MSSAVLKSAIFRVARKMRPILPYGILANLGQWFSAYAHEPDFEIFDWLRNMDGLVIDAGASRGQSALSVLRRTTKMKVFSLEPNRKHRWSLSVIRLLHPIRYRFRMVAAGEDFSSQTLHVPGRRASGLSAQGSLDPEEFEKDYVRDRLADSGFDAKDKTGYRKVPVKVIPVDSLGLSPDLIKIDVEGFELQAIKGLQQTLTEYFPALLIEINNTHRWLDILEDLGYVFYHYNEGSQILERPNNIHDALNLFCLHPQSPSCVTAVLLHHVNNNSGES